MKKVMMLSAALVLGLTVGSMAQATNGNPNGVSTQAGSTGSSTQGGTGTMQQDRSSKSSSKMHAGHSGGSSMNSGATTGSSTSNGSSSESGSGKSMKSGKTKKSSSDKKTAPSASNS